MEGTGRAGWHLTPIGPTDTVRFVTNDFMFTGGDGYTVFGSATDVLFTGEVLLDVVVDHIRTNSPVSPPSPRRSRAAVCAPSPTTAGSSGSEFAGSPGSSVLDQPGEPEAW